MQLAASFFFLLSKKNNKILARDYIPRSRRIAQSVVVVKGTSVFFATVSHIINLLSLLNLDQVSIEAVGGATRKAGKIAWAVIKAVEFGLERTVKRDSIVALKAGTLEKKPLPRVTITLKKK
jgi:hypothetical protein